MTAASPSGPVAQEVSFLIIGAGFSGLGAAIKLTQAGHTDLVILERAQDVGGTWRDNTYPGCRCDVQSNLYS
jgi:cation diffusion facilitator CzcD-associated flavoprotein CzcO